MEGAVVEVALAFAAESDQVLCLVEPTVAAKLLVLHFKVS